MSNKNDGGTIKGTPFGATPRIPSENQDQKTTDLYDQKTKAVPRPNQEHPSGGTSSMDDEKTILQRTGSNRVESNVEQDAPELVTGWLVIIDGPGTGVSLTIGVGHNSIGREQSERVVVDFGDSEISRKDHAVISYEPKGNKFYLGKGNTTNFTYLNDAPVLSPMELTDRSILQLGQTKLRFITFCDEQFTWNDM